MIIKAIKRCARCGKDHDDLLFKEFVRPIADAYPDGLPWTHWAMCPVNKDPIVLCIMQDKEWYREQEGEQSES